MVSIGNRTWLKVLKLIMLSHRKVILKLALFLEKPMKKVYFFRRTSVKLRLITARQWKEKITMDSIVMLSAWSKASFLLRAKIRRILKKASIWWARSLIILKIHPLKHWLRWDKFTNMVISKVILRNSLQLDKISTKQFFSTKRQEIIDSQELPTTWLFSILMQNLMKNRGNQNWQAQLKVTATLLHTSNRPKKQVSVKLITTLAPYFPRDC